MKKILRANRKDPKNFWRSIKSIIDNGNGDGESFSFKDPDSGQDISGLEAGHFINHYFANIATRTCADEDKLPYIPGEEVHSKFDLLLPEIYDVMIFAEDIDVNSSSGITGI